MILMDQWKYSFLISRIGAIVLGVLHTLETKNNGVFGNTGAAVLDVTLENPSLWSVAGIENGDANQDC